MGRNHRPAQAARSAISDCPPRHECRSVSMSGSKLLADTLSAQKPPRRCAKCAKSKPRLGSGGPIKALSPTEQGAQTGTSRLLVGPIKVWRVSPKGLESVPARLRKTSVLLWRGACFASPMELKPCKPLILYQISTYAPLQTTGNRRCCVRSSVLSFILHYLGRGWWHRGH